MEAGLESGDRVNECVDLVEAIHALSSRWLDLVDAFVDEAP